MATNTQKKVLLYGNVFRDYRSRILIKLLLDSKYHISLVCPDFYIKERMGQSYSIEKVFIVFYLAEFFIKAAFADIIYLPPMNTRFIKSAIWASKLFNKKLVVEMYVSLYDTFVKDRKLIEDGSRKAKVLIEKDRLALTKSDYVIHTTNHELSYWERIVGTSINSDKTSIAPNCNVSALVLRRSFMQDSILRICWWGTFIPLHGLDNILQAMKILKEQEVQFTCNLFGVNNSFFSSYAEKIQLAELNHHVFLRKDLTFSNSSLPRHLVDNCDLALGIFGNTDKARSSVPNKLIEALSMGIPTLTMNSPALSEFFNPETDLWVCEPSPEAIAESILTIARGVAYPVDWEQTRQKVLNTFSVARYQEVVSNVLERALGKATNNLLASETSVVKVECL
jgi:glycosyltransferase involved in cell wall biosynthesis